MNFIFPSDIRTPERRESLTALGVGVAWAVRGPWTLLGASADSVDHCTSSLKIESVVYWERLRQPRYVL
jgi:hypothetical protein